MAQPRFPSISLLLLLAALLACGDLSMAEAGYRKLQILHQKGDASAKRHLLQALEEAPRFREAHRLLLEMTAKTAAAPPASTVTRGCRGRSVQASRAMVTTCWAPSESLAVCG